MSKSTKWWLDEGEQEAPQSLSSKISDAIKGHFVGALQGGSNLGSNIAQAPGDLYHALTGKQSYQAPRPDFKDLIPNSDIGRKAHDISEVVSPIVGSPGLAAETILGKSLYGGRWIPRLISDALLGGAEANSGERQKGMAEGLAMPLAGKVISETVKTPLTEYGATKRLNKANKLGDSISGIPISIDNLRNLEYQLQSRELRPSKEAINTLLGQAAEGTYPAYRNLQSGLKDVSRELRYGPNQQSSGLKQWISNFISPHQSTASERLTANELDKIIKSYTENARQYMHNIGHGHVADLERQGVEDYARYMKYKNMRNNTLKSIALGGAASVPPWLLSLYMKPYKSG